MYVSKLAQFSLWQTCRYRTYLRALEPLMCIDKPPDDDRGHRSTVHKTGPIHTSRTIILQHRCPKNGGGSTYPRSAPVVLGKHKIGTMSATKAQAADPIYMLYRPKFHGPALNRLPTKNTLMKMGIVKATNAATAAIEKSAPAARGPPKMRRVMQMPRVVLNHTAFTGVWVCRFTRLIHHEQGKQPSRA